MQAKKLGFLTSAVFVWMSLVALGQSSSDPLQWTAQEAIARALEQHADVRQAELALDLAELELHAAQAQGIVPSINLELTPPSLSSAGLSGALAGHLALELPLSWGTSSQLLGSLDLAWNPSTGEWGRSAWEVSFSQSLRLSQPRAASKNLRNKEEAVQDARVSLVAARNAVVRTTVEGYGSLLNEQRLVDQAQADVAQAEADLGKEKELVDAGLAAEASLVQARLGLLDAQIRLSERESTSTADKERFGRLVLGTDEDYALVPLKLPLNALKKAASALLTQEDLVAKAVAQASEVRSAEQAVVSAQEAVQAARRAALPNLSLKATMGDVGWQVGLSLGFPLFSPTRDFDVKIAEAKLLMAQGKLAAAQENVKDRLLTRQTTLRSALASLDRLPMEQEKWSLDETVTKAKWEAGSLSDEDWQTFLEDKRAFATDADRRGVTLLVAYLACRDGLGLELDVEEWLK